MKIEAIFAVVLLATLSITIISLKILIPFLASRKMGQKIETMDFRYTNSFRCV